MSCFDIWECMYLLRKLSQKHTPYKTDDILHFRYFMKTKKTRSAILSNFAVVARRDLCSEAQS